MNAYLKGSIFGVFLGFSIVMITYCTQQKAEGQTSNRNQFTSDRAVGYNCYQNKFTVDSLEYILVYAKYDGGIHFVNLTKEKLEIELLRKQLEKLKVK